MTTKSTSNISHVVIHPYAQKHFVKDFLKVHKSVWTQTRKFIEYELLHLDNLLLTSKAEVINENESHRIIKVEFKIAGSKESAKTSWNRIIVCHNMCECICHVLLVYNKTHIKWDNETARRVREVKNNCGIEWL